MLDRFIERKQSLVRFVASRAILRAALNAYSKKLNARSTSMFFGRYAKIFRQDKSALDAGNWQVSFMGKTINLPLRSEYSWLDWDLALAIIGHDIEIKTTYERLAKSKYRPDLFFDVGANYGLHSILFSSAGIPAVAFEPNPRCLEYCKLAASLNNFHIRSEQIAVGEKDEDALLVFPERDTWNGMISDKVTEDQLKQFGHVETTRVTLKKLDNYIAELEGKKLLLKIDVEGGELAVLKGASNILERVRPIIIFESNSEEGRSGLYSLLSSKKYNVQSLPWTDDADHRTILSQDAFRASAETNFMAAPCEDYAAASAPHG